MKYSHMALALSLAMTSNSIFAADYDMTIAAGFIDSNSETLPQESIGGLSIYSFTTLNKLGRAENLAQVKVTSLVTQANDYSNITLSDECYSASVCLVNESSIGSYELDVTSELLLPHTRTEAGWSRTTNFAVNNLTTVGSNFDNTFIDFLGENTSFAPPIFGITFSGVPLGGRIIRYSLNAEDDQRTHTELLLNFVAKDMDSDGIIDLEDLFPNDPTEWADNDLDGIGDNADPDDDNDGMPDAYETRVGLNPLVADADGDADGDGLTNLEEFEYGTDPFNTDSDGDGINDKLDNNPTVPDDSNASELGSGIPLLWQDVNGDGVTELGVFSVVDDVPTLAVMNLVNNAELSRITWAADAYLPSSMTPIALPDMDNDDVMDIGLFGIRQDDGNEGKPQFFVRSGRTGNRLSVFNWPANWKNMRVVVMDDLTGDGVPEVALEGTFKDGARPQLRVQNGASGANVGVYSFPAIFDSPAYYQHSDYDGDGVRDVALFGRIKRNNKIQVKLISGANSNDKLDAYNFPDKWENVSWHKLFDMNGDSESEWGLFGSSREDGRTMLLVKDAADKRGLVASYAWPNMDSPTLLTIPDISGDGTPELAAAGLNTATNRYQLQIKDGSDRNNTLNNITWPNRYSDVSFHVFNDMDDDGLADVVLQGLNTTSGNYELVIVNAVNRNTITTINLGSDWDSAPTVYQVGDTDGDGVPNVVVFGSNEGKTSFTFQ